MLATVDWVAQRYGVLPSKLLAEGSSIDIHLAELGQKYENFLRENADRKSKGLAPVAPELTQDQMLAMVAQVKQGKQKQ